MKQSRSWHFAACHDARAPHHPCAVGGTMELEFGIIFLVAVTILGSALGIAWRDAGRDCAQAQSAGGRK